MKQIFAQYTLRIKNNVLWLVSFVVFTPVLITARGVMLQDGEGCGCGNQCGCGSKCGCA